MSTKKRHARRNPVPPGQKVVTKATTVRSRVQAQLRAGTNSLRVAWACIAVAREVVRERERKGRLDDDRYDVMLNIAAEVCQGSSPRSELKEAWSMRPGRAYMHGTARLAMDDAVYYAVLVTSHASLEDVYPTNRDAIPAEAAKVTKNAIKALVAMKEPEPAARARIEGLFLAVLEAP